jgi:Holliday junction resolvase RusA-like endonuclease
MQEFKLLQLPCSGNAMYRSFHGRVVLSSAGRTFRAEVAKELALSTIQCVHGSVGVSIDLSFKHKRKRDVDNYAKSILDAVKGTMFDDDADIYDLRVTKRIGTSEDNVVIKCWPMAVFDHSKREVGEPSAPHS